jgi:tetratricopeptide (TPR) repeat protein
MGKTITGGVETGMGRIFTINLFVLLFLLSFTGCSRVQDALRSARGSFPGKHIYRPSYKTIGAMYKSEPTLAIEFLERLSRKRKKNLAYRLTLVDMYKDNGRVNDAIRLWFEILALSREEGIAEGENLQVYFIPIVPYQEEGIRPYRHKIDKTLVYDNIGQIYFQNAFYGEAADTFSKAAENASDLNQKARLYQKAGQAIGSRTVEFFISDKDGQPYQRIGDRTVPVDLMQYKRKEMDFYTKALAFNFTDQDLYDDIQESLMLADEEVARHDGRPSLEEIEEAVLAQEAGTPGPPEVEEKPDLRSQALDLFSQGKIDEAVAIWDILYSEFLSEAYLIEVEMDCEPDTLKQTYDELAGPENFFVISRPYRERSCYLLCLGPYASTEEASSAVQYLKTVLPMAAPSVEKWGQ